MIPKEISLSKVKLRHSEYPLEDIEKKVREILSPLGKIIKPKSRIAVAVGSRGIANINIIVSEVIDYVKNAGGVPFIVPAMGSHGGATAEGQREILAGYGITEERTGAPVLSSMETVFIGNAQCEPSFPVYMDRYAYESDGVIVINRVKPHTDFHGEHESGIVKMLVIGLGKQVQAETMHRFGVSGLAKLMPYAAQTVLDSHKILCGLAILEDGLDNTSDIVFSVPSDFFNVDNDLLIKSRQYMAKLPFKDIDVLVVDEIGKNFSGTGMDTNVIGRVRISGQKDTEPLCHYIVVLDLAQASHGNAMGIGLSDITTQRVSEKIDWKTTNENVITSGFLQRGFLPIVASDDEDAIAIALNCVACTSDEVRMVRIKNTLDLNEVYVSNSLLNELRKNGIEHSVLKQTQLAFHNGNITEF